MSKSQGKVLWSWLIIGLISGLGWGILGLTSIKNQLGSGVEIIPILLVFFGVVGIIFTLIGRLVSKLTRFFFKKPVYRIMQVQAFGMIPLLAIFVMFLGGMWGSKISFFEALSVFFLKPDVGFKVLIFVLVFTFINANLIKFLYNKLNWKLETN